MAESAAQLLCGPVLVDISRQPVRGLHPQDEFDLKTLFSRPDSHWNIPAIHNAAV